MRPVPPSRHQLAVLIFVAVSAGVAYLAMHDPQLGPAQVDIACAALKDHQPDLFAGDPIFGGSRLWLFHTPVLLGMLKLVLVPTNYADLILPFRLLAGAMTMLFLGGMYALLYRQTRSWSVSAFVAVMSMTVTYVLGGSNWGLGPLATITPQTILLAMVPLIVLAYLNYERQWRLALVFAFIGLVGNVHLVTAMNLTLVLLLVFLGRHRFGAQAWLKAGACGLCALAAALPYAGYYFGIRSGLDHTGTVAAGVIQQAFHITKQEVLYPELLKGLLDVNLLWRLVVLIVVAVAVLCRWERFKVRDANFWVWMIAAVAAVSLVLQGVSQLLGALWGGGPPVIDFLRASNLLLLPLYVLLAQGLVNLFRLIRQFRPLLRWCCAALLVVWLVPSDNLLLVRQRVYLAAGRFFAEQDKPRQLRHIEDERQRLAELSAIAAWARGEGGATCLGKPCKSDATALFVTDHAEFRIYSRHPIVAAREDVRFIYYLAPAGVDEWMHRFARQQHVLHGTADDASLRQFFGDLAVQEEMRQIREWYVIVDASVPTEKYGSLQSVVSESWGRQYRLYRVDMTRMRSE